MGLWLSRIYNTGPCTQQSLIDVAKVRTSEEAREGTAQVMFDFLTSQEFAHTVEQMIVSNIPDARTAPKRKAFNIPVMERARL